MTTHYIDLRVIHDPEIPLPQLFATLYVRLHLTLVQQHLNDIGASFPGYSTNPRTLGSILRLHGSRESLQHFMQPEWLRGVRDHVRMSGILAAPAEACHRTVQRRQFKTSADRLRRRRMQRKGETARQASEAIPDTVERNPTLPFLNLRSRSTGQLYSLFILLGPTAGQPTPGTFNSYGLSRTATVPWF